MATVRPPPSKRQRLEASERAREQQDVEVVPSDAGSLRYQFIDQITGLVIGQPILIPVADATPKNLELLLNKMLDHVSIYPSISDAECLCVLNDLSTTMNDTDFP